MRLLWLVVLCFAFDVAFHEDVERDFEVVDGDRESEKRIVLAFDLFEPAAITKPPTIRTRSPTPKPIATASPTFSQSGSFSQIDLRSMRVVENESWGRNVVVFVLDTGCQIDRFPSSASIRPGESFVFDEPDTSVDLHGHGTHVAGLIHAVAPKAEIVCVRVFDRRGDGYLTSILKAFQHVAKRCSKNVSCVLNLSGGAHESKLLEEAATRLVLKRNVVVVAAAGNYVETKCLTPAKTPWVVSVGASDLREIAFISAYGPCVDVFAPGVSVPSFAPHGWSFKSGTSMANAYVSGIAAKTRFKIDSAKRVHDFLIETAETFRGIKFARASDEREKRFTVESDERVHRDWFANCVSFVSNEYEIDFEEKQLVRTRDSLRFGNVEFKTITANRTRIVWDNSGGAVFENDVYVAKWTWKRNRRMTLGRGYYNDVRSCADVVPPHEPCPMRDFKTCTPPCVWTTSCNRPLDCFTKNQITCAKFKRCAWRNGSCKRT